MAAAATRSITGMQKDAKTSLYKNNIAAGACTSGSCCSSTSRSFMCKQSERLISIPNNKDERRPRTASRRSVAAMQYSNLITIRAAVASNAANSGVHEHRQAPTTSTLSSSAATRNKLLPSAAELETLQLPALHCSFGPSLLSPHYHQLKEQCDQWIEAVAQPPSAAACRFLHACLLPRLVCRYIPKAPLGPPLLHAIKFIAWLMISDEDDDNPDLLGSDFSATAHRAGRVMAILSQDHDHNDDQNVGRPEPSDGRLSSRCCVRLAALAELWQDMRQAMSPSLRARFVSSMADYFEGLKMQAALRNEFRVPDVDSYMEIRRYASFTFPCFILVEYAMGIDLDNATVEDENIVELQKLAVDYISLCNDIFSCHKEISLGDFFNLPSVLYDPPLDGSISATKGTLFLQNAVDNVAAIASHVDARCDSLIASIKAEYSKPTVPLARAYNAHAYVEAVTLGMVGALAWFHESARYKHTTLYTSTH